MTSEKIIIKSLIKINSNIMIIKFKTHLPIQITMDRIVRVLNAINDVKASGEFINETPRHNLIIMEIPDNTPSDTIFELGMLCGTLDHD